ncbi:MAG: MBL fold metallo-hydrolase [Acidimicrobiia bacterium]|nr:MBL fold metallo-hydrolase [Acidimicrobiia bacterium]
MHGPMRQEKQPASTEVVEVAPGVLRLQLTITMPGLGHVNCYVLEDDHGLALVDPGLPGPGPWKEFERRLASAGFPVERVHTVIITHSHPDHFGAAGHLRRVSGAEIVTHADFKTFWDPGEEDDEHKDLADPRDLDTWAAARERLARLASRVRPESGPSWRWDRPTPWGGPHPRPDRKTRLRYRVQGVVQARYFQPPRPSRRVIDGQVLPLGGREWVAVHTPGHTVDHLCLLDPVDGTLISGDHVLPTITPHISGLVHADDPLALYLASLERTLEIPGVTRVLPAHGHPFDDLRGRVKSIHEHHLERLDLLRTAAVDVGEASVAAYSERLFRPQSWGPMADSETYAHLEHLRLLGEARRHWVEGELRYAVEPDSRIARADAATST